MIRFRMNHYRLPVPWWRHIFSRSTHGNIIVRFGPHWHLWIFIK